MHGSTKIAGWQFVNKGDFGGQLAPCPPPSDFKTPTALILEGYMMTRFRSFETLTHHLMSIYCDDGAAQFREST